jgi:nucleotide-binding universal stress UspA family protein
MLVPRLFFRIGVAIAFSPRREALLAEARRWRDLFGAELAIIIVADKQEHRSSQIETLLIQNNLDPDEIILIWEESQGPIAKQLVAICHAHQIDLLLAGALRNEARSSYSMGNVARQILLTAPCSVMVLLEPNKTPKPIQKIVAMEHRALKGYHPFSNQVESLATLPDVQRIDYVVEISRPTFWMRIIETVDKKRYQINKAKRVKIALQRRKLHLQDMNAKVKLVMHAASTHPEYKTGLLAQKVRAQLIVMRAPLQKSARIKHIIFRDSFRELIGDLPCNLLVLRNK